MKAFISQHFFKNDVLNWDLKVNHNCKDGLKNDSLNLR